MGNMVKCHLYQKYKNSWVWWCASVVPATWEAKEGESLESGKLRLQGAVIRPLHSSLGNIVSKKVVMCLLSVSGHQNEHLMRDGVLSIFFSDLSPVSRAVLEF